MRRRQVWAAQTAQAMLRDAAAMHDPGAAVQELAELLAAAPVQTEMAPSAIMMLSEAEPKGGDPIPLPGKPCPKCGKPLAVRGRHFHVRACRG